MSNFDNQINCQAQFQKAVAVAIELRKHYNHMLTAPSRTGIVPMYCTMFPFATFFLDPQFFWTHNLFGPTFFGPTIFLDPQFLWAFPLETRDKAFPNLDFILKFSSIHQSNWQIKTMLVQVIKDLNKARKV